MLNSQLIKYINFIIIFFLLYFFNYCQSYYKELKIYPENLKTFYLDNFSNQTFEPYIHLELTDVLKEKLFTRNLLYYTNNISDARYILSGNIILFRREVLLYSNELQPTHYRVDLVVEITISKKNQILTKEELYDSIRYSTKDIEAENDFITRRRLYDRISYKILYYLEKTILEDLKGAPNE
jgi:hypothetical protein